MIAFHPCNSLSENITARVETELPFLWNFVSKEDWIAVSNCARDYCARHFHDDEDGHIWQMYMGLILKNFELYCPSVNALLHIAVSLPCDAQLLSMVRTGYTLKLFANVLFNESSSDMQKLIRRHANDTWPMAFLDSVNYMKKISNVRKFLPFSQNWRNSVIGLPILLTLQAFAPQIRFLKIPPEPSTGPRPYGGVN